jgi:iron complex transport system substrate-binding protein
VKARWLALLCAVALPLAAQSIVLRDDRGVSMRLTAPPQRIVSLLPSLTEIVCALDACERLVGTDQFSDWPGQVKALPKLGGLDDAQVERIVALKPDIVLMSRMPRVPERLEALGLKVMVLDSDSHADVRRALDRFATLLGRPAAGAQRWLAIEAEIAAAAARVPKALRGRSVYFEVDEGPYAAGTTSFIGQTLTRLGLGNIVPASMGAFPLLNPEFVVRANPAIIMATAKDLAAMPSRPGWRGLSALAGRSCGFDGPHYDLLIRPGPRMGEAARVIADCLAGLASR